MCGLVGVIRRGGGVIPPDVVARMAAAIAHRGPDDEGSFNAPGVAFHHRRLSIIDLATGHQPMSANGLTTVFNGEIYNYIELRDELIKRGHTFRTTSDTEVLLRGYLEWGPDVVKRLNGMFAFLIYDAPSRRVVAARDHFGVKPLYWSRVGDAIVYASEIKAILLWPGVVAERDDLALSEYITFQHTLEDLTLFRGIRKLLPAHLQVVDLDTLEVSTRQFWTPSAGQERQLSEAEAVDELRALLKDSARLQVRSDVPLGAYLSGGLDSSTVATLAAERVGSGMPVFTGAFREGPEFDESGHARTVAEQIRAKMFLVYPSANEFVDLLPRLAWHMDEPAAGPGLFPQYIVSRCAAQHVKVCLGGQGGDELFGGYARYLVANLDLSLAAEIHGSHDASPRLSDLLDGLGSLRQYGPMIQRLFQAGFLKESPSERYFRLLDRTEGMLPAYSAAVRESLDQHKVLARFDKVFSQSTGRDHFDRLTAFDLATSMPALLQVEDRVSMAVSLESRVPLLDYRIADFLAGLPSALKYPGGKLKHLFKQAVSPWLPKSILQRQDKMGFPVPLHLWSRGGLRDFFADILLSQRCRQRGLFDTQVVERLIGEEAAFGRALWGLLQLELWHRVFIDGAASESGP
jgi:asparagine synthase (glutamine-hydrolysing)